MVKNTRLVECDSAIRIPGIREFVLDSLAHVSEGIEFVFFGQAVALVDEDFEVYAWVVLEQEDGCFYQLADAVEVLVLHVEDPYYGSCGCEDCVAVEVWGGKGEVGGDFHAFEFHEGAGWFCQLMVFVDNGCTDSIVADSTLPVGSRKRVSAGENFSKITFWIEDLPLLH